MNPQSLSGIAQDIMKDLAGGVLRMDDNIGARQVMEKVRQARGAVIQDYFLKSGMRSIDQQWLQEYSPVYDKTIQVVNAPYVKFKIPFILFLPKNAGFYSCTRQDGVTPYLLAENINKVSGLSNRRDINLKQDRFQIATVSNNELLIFGDLSIRKPLLRAVFQDPCETLLGLDDEEDIYPISSNMIPFIKDLVKKELQYAAVTPSDDVNDSRDTGAMLRAQGRQG